jgi:hypothetical protein
MFETPPARRGGAVRAAFVVFLIALAGPAAAQNPIHVTYLWHMHQPIYYPYEPVSATDGAGRFNFSVCGVHDARTGSYGEWPKNAVQQGTDLPHAGVQVSFSGSLMENMDGLYGTGWREHYRWGRNGLRTIRNNPRLDAVGIAYHHSLMPLTTKESMRMQIRLHKEAYKDVWNTGGSYTKGFWPPECAFAVNMIPALVDEGLEWVIVDNGHFDRAAQNYPWAPASSIRPNKADQLNPDPATIGSQWVQLNNVWAPTKVSAPWGYQPHYVQYVDPWSNPTNPTVQRIIAVPAGRYEGNENGRGGYGAFKPENVWTTHIARNNNPQRPMLLLCHSDGDNFGMLNADAYNGQHGNFLNMVRANPNFEHTSVQDYLELYPVPTNDIIHVEPGSWVGIDGGTPYFDKWREDNARSGEHPDLWSWSVLVAAANRVIHADSLESNYTMNDVRWGITHDTAKAWRFYLQAETSCHWYWDFDRANPWDGNATRGANLAIAEANKVLARRPGVDAVGPTIWPPQRDIYNPGGKHYNEATNQPSNFNVFTFVDDTSGLASVKLYWRTDNDGENPINEYDNELFAANLSKVSAWNTVDMTGDFYPPVKGPLVPDPANRAKRYMAPINGQTNVLVDYFVEATDTKGNLSRSDLAHVWVGAASGGGGGGGGGSLVTAEQPVAGGPVTIRYAKAGTLLGGAQVFIHIGHSGWKDVILPNPPMIDGGDFWTYSYQPPAGATEINFAFRSASNQWDNNSGGDYRATVTGGTPEIPAAPTGLSATAAAHNRINLAWAAVPGATVYKILRGGTQIATSATASHADTTVAPSTTYGYAVIASNSAGDSLPSVTVSATTPAQPVAPPDFVLSGTARPGYLLTAPGMKIHAAVRGTKLYVATWFAATANGNDHFIFITDQLLGSASAALAPAWNKAGQIAAATNKPYLAQESSNGWTGWFNAPSGSTANASSSGNVVEGVIDLVDAFGSLPPTIYVAVAAVQTANSGALAAQAPAAVTANGNLEPSEFLAIPTASIADSAGDHRFDRADRDRLFRVKGLRKTPGGVGIDVPTVPGVRYLVQHKARLSDPTWVTTGEITGTGHDSQELPASPPPAAAGEPQGFFRVILAP